MALSQLWTAKEFFLEATQRDLKLEQNTASYVERFQILSRAQDAVVGGLYDILGPSYRKDTSIFSSTTGKYSTAGGTFTLATRRIVITMDTGFVAGDVGKKLVFRVGTSIYEASVDDVVNTTTVVVSGHSLPTSDQTVDYAMLLSTNITSDTMSLSGLRLLHDSTSRLHVTSSVTEEVDPVSVEELADFRTDAPQNLSRIVWALIGSRLDFKKGDSLSSYGTTVLFYPGLPNEITSDTQKMDVPDGLAVEVTLVKVKNMVAMREQIEIPDQRPRMQALVGELLRSFQGQVALESIKDKVQRIL